MISINRELERYKRDKENFIDNQTDVLDIEARLKIDRIKETRIYLPIFRQTNDIWACCLNVFNMSEK